MATFCDIDEDKIDGYYKEEYVLTKNLFTFNEEMDFRQLIDLFNTYISSDPTHHDIAEYILGIFSKFRSKNKELLSKIENATSLTPSIYHRTSFYNYLYDYYDYIMPKINGFPDHLSPICNAIKGDQLQKLQQEIIKISNNFDLLQDIDIQWYDNVKLTDIAAHFGAVQCFKYLILNYTRFSDHIYEFAISGGNYEIIHFLERDYDASMFGEENCFLISVAYHHYAISDWLLRHYTYQGLHIEIAIENFNYMAFTYMIENMQPQLDCISLVTASKLGNLPIIKYLMEKRSLKCENHDEQMEICNNSRNKNIIDYIYRLHIACTDGDLDKVKRLCEEGKIDFSTRDKNGNTALHIACEKNKIDIVRYLIEGKYFNKDVYSFSYDTPLHVACQNNCVDVIKYLCEEAKVNINAKNTHGYTPLFISCQLGFADTVKYLIEEQHAHTYGSQTGESLLFIAAKNGHLDIVKYLCEEQHFDTELKTEDGMRALNVAKSNEIVDYLMRLHIACKEGNLSKVISICEGPYINKNVTDSDYYTALHIACESGKIDIVRYLTEEQHFDIEAVDKMGRTPLHVSCQYGFIDIVKYLCEEQNANKEATTNDMRTPLHVASANGFVNIVKYLCEEQHVNKEAIDRKGKTPVALATDTEVLDYFLRLHNACKNGLLDRVKHFIEVEHIDTQIKNKNGKTAIEVTRDKNVLQYLLRLHNACKDGDLTKVIELCEEQKADVEAKDKKGKTPLHIACENNKIDIVRYLCEKQIANKEALDKDGRTPLLVACSKKCMGIVKYLVEEQHVDTNAEDNGKRNALIIATEQNDFRMIEYLSNL